MKGVRGSWFGQTIFCLIGVLLLAGATWSSAQAVRLRAIQVVCSRTVHSPTIPGETASAPRTISGPCPEFMFSDWKQDDQTKLCQLNRAESYELEADGQGHAYIEFMMDKRRKMIVDTGGVRSVLYSSIVDELHLETYNAEDVGWKDPFGSGEQVGFTGFRLDRITRVPKIWIGPVHFENATFMVIPDSRHAPLGDNEIAGLLAPSHLMTFDLEFDFAGHKLNMFLQNDCPDRVVYWSKYYSVIPFEVDETGHILLPVSVDGVSMTAMVDTGAPKSVMFLEAAKQLFGLTENSLRAEPGNKAAPADERADDLFHHRFKRISMNGVDILNPEVTIAPNRMEEHPSTRSPQLIIGLRELSALHLFIAYSQNELYVTGKDAH